jgi:N-glycosylase/DNA lyase
MGGVELFAYPAPSALADAGEPALRECGLGYRAKFLHLTATRIADGSFDLAAIAPLDDDAALARLCELPGVGPKIAQCALLFAWERLGVFPIDVWIERALRELYFSKARRPPSSKELRQFAWDHFGPCRGYAQQWLFHHARTGGIFSRTRKRG